MRYKFLFEAKKSDKKTKVEDRILNGFSGGKIDLQPYEALLMTIEIKTMV